MLVKWMNEYIDLCLYFIFHGQELLFLCCMALLQIYGKCLKNIYSTTILIYHHHFLLHDLMQEELTACIGFSITWLFFPGGSEVKNLPANAGDTVNTGLISVWIRKIPLEKEMSGKWYGQRNLAGCHPWGSKSRAWLSNWECNILIFVIKIKFLW